MRKEGGMEEVRERTKNEGDRVIVVMRYMYMHPRSQTTGILQFD